MCVDMIISGGELAVNIESIPRIVDTQASNNFFSCPSFFESSSLLRAF